MQYEQKLHLFLFFFKCYILETEYIMYVMLSDLYKQG